MLMETAISNFEALQESFWNASLIESINSVDARLAIMENTALQQRIQTTSGLGAASEWLQVNGAYRELMLALANGFQQAIYANLSADASQNMQRFIEVLVMLILALTGCPALFFWYAIKSERLMTTLRQMKHAEKMKVLTLLCMDLE